MSRVTTAIPAEAGIQRRKPDLNRRPALQHRQGAGCDE